MTLSVSEAAHSAMLWLAEADVTHVTVTAWQSWKSFAIIQVYDFHNCLVEEFDVECNQLSSPGVKVEFIVDELLSASAEDGVYLQRHKMNLDTKFTAFTDARQKVSIRRASCRSIATGCLA
jgi:hypothetical protein